MPEFSINEKIALAYLRAAEPHCVDDGAPEGCCELRRLIARGRRAGLRCERRPMSHEILALRAIAALQNADEPLARSFCACLGDCAEPIEKAARQAADELLCLGVALPSPRGQYGRMLAA
ncbi:MAG: hypothetical protein Tsb0010_04040 [Parvularculaceae bacterium]